MWTESRYPNVESENRAAISAALLTGLATAAATAATVYLLDPQLGRRRRALLRDQLAGRRRQTGEFLGKAARDARERAQGIFAATRSRLRSEQPEDRVLEERVRAELGRLTSHPGAIDVICSEGRVRLTGDVLEAEAEQLVRGLNTVQGVREVVNALRAHPDAGRIPSLQGESTRRLQPRFEYLQTNWAPAPRVLAGAGGAAMIVGGAASRSIPGAAIALAGVALLARSVANRPLSQFFGALEDVADGLLVQKTINVYAEVEEVYERWRDLESFPQFMSHVREVRDLGDGRYHWVVDGPAGTAVEWDAEITADEPGEFIAWRTVEGSPVQSAGQVRFEPSAQGGTRVHVRMAYRPPGSVLGHELAALFGRSPKQQLDDDMLRFKNLVERGPAPVREGGEMRH